MAVDVDRHGSRSRGRSPISGIEREGAGLVASDIRPLEEESRRISRTLRCYRRRSERSTRVAVGCTSEDKILSPTQSAVGDPHREVRRPSRDDRICSSSKGSREEARTVAIGAAQTTKLLEGHIVKLASVGAVDHHVAGGHGVGSGKGSTEGSRAAVSHKDVESVRKHGVGSEGNVASECRGARTGLD